MRKLLLFGRTDGLGRSSSVQIGTCVAGALALLLIVSSPLPAQAQGGGAKAPAAGAGGAKGGNAAGQPAANAANAAGLTPREVKDKARYALAQGAYDDAVAYLQQLIDWYGESKDVRVVAEMAPVFFNKGLCYFLLGQFLPAEAAFEDYLKKYRNGSKIVEASVFIGDCYRFSSDIPKATKAYQAVLNKYESQMAPDWKADVYSSLVRCALAGDDWKTALPLLKQVYTIAPDTWRANWAATLMTIAYLKELDVEKVYQLVPFLLRPRSFASRSVAFNMAALEAGDDLFADERYRDALWIYRLVYPHDVLQVRSEEFLAEMQKQAEFLKRHEGLYRELMRVQETIGELEGELKALEGIENYDVELTSRIARSYMEIRRYRESRSLFLYLYKQASGQQADEALYFAFYCSTQLTPWDRAFELGDEYMQKFATGEYYDQVSLTMGQLYARQQNWQKVISVLTKAMETHPKHESGAECMFLIGYASFMEEKFADALLWLKRVTTEYPGNERNEEATYWMGMTLLFNIQYDEASKVFDRFVKEYRKSPFVEDATFRRAVCDYGASRFKEAEAELSAFVATYGKSKLVGEAYMMMGDIAGVFEDGEKATKRLRTAMDFELNIEHYNYCAFRCGEILNEMKDYKAVVRHFQGYIQRNVEGSNIPMAIYWVGRALWELGEKEGALTYYRQSLEKYGKDRKELGIDMILDEWVGRTKNVTKEESRRAWRDLMRLYEDAKTLDNRPLALRIERILIFKPDVTDTEKTAYVNDLLREDNITNAPACVLEFMADESMKQGNEDLAVKAAEAIIKDFTETDHALAARGMLAKYAIKNKDYATAIKHLTVIREVFATSPEAAEALLTLGNLYLDQKNYDERTGVSKTS